MLAETASVTVNEQDQAVKDAGTASRLAGFDAALIHGRKDGPTLVVTGAHTIALTINRSQLVTILTQAGVQVTDVGRAADGTVVTIHTARGIRAQYGHCPAPANTLQNQVQGPPPPSADNADCVVLAEYPAASLGLPPGLNVRPLEEIALELSGMSPTESRVIEGTFDAPSALSLPIPRFTRSYDTLEVAGARAILLSTAGRRGPTYVLIWAKNGVLYSLSGYGSAADGAPLAASVN
ncbi:MAG TPA: hypothetical protein VH163_04950 [Gemmatimonadales bacterium]|jgi:hypothetical protein|nr:hypothetical protein [Gemmatimonadales bacterium]